MSLVPRIDSGDNNTNPGRVAVGVICRIELLRPTVTTVVDMDTGNLEVTQAYQIRYQFIYQGSDDFD